MFAKYYEIRHCLFKIMIAVAPHQTQIYRVLPGLVECDCKYQNNMFWWWIGHDTTLRQHSKVSSGGKAEFTEKHVRTKKTSTREFMQSGQILVGALCVDNDSGLILVHGRYMNLHLKCIRFDCMHMYFHRFCCFR